ncbi:unnamed protein product [Mytilus edulis]|uniref:Uncharacterized protein n=1 Tax=Mytilus edulis TaxID=6550 RepID=A0A8S3Q4J7_MYTED|nr:unnamed protein product [Mytilus edulis]
MIGGDAAETKFQVWSGSRRTTGFRRQNYRSSHFPKPHQPCQGHSNSKFTGYFATSVLAFIHLPVYLEEGNPTVGSFEPYINNWDGISSTTALSWVISSVSSESLLLLEVQYNFKLYRANSKDFGFTGIKPVWLLERLDQMLAQNQSEAKTAKA